MRDMDVEHPRLLFRDEKQPLAPEAFTQLPARTPWMAKTRKKPRMNKGEFENLGSQSADSVAMIHRAGRPTIPFGPGGCGRMGPILPSTLIKPNTQYYFLTMTSVLAALLEK